MLVQSLYNIVDSLFLTNITYVEEGYKGLNIGKDSFNAVSIVMPMTMFVTAVAIGIGVGANAYIARKLGEGNRESANKGAKTAIVMALFAWAIMAVMAFTLSRPFVQAFVNDGNATDVNYVVEKGTMYLTIYMAASGGVTLDIVSARILQATGNMKVPMISQLIGAVTNIVLDALFIMVFKMGVFGAILATVIGQWFAASFNLAFFIFKKQDVSISQRLPLQCALLRTYSQNRIARPCYERHEFRCYHYSQRYVAFLHKRNHRFVCVLQGAVLYLHARVRTHAGNNAYSQLQLRRKLAKEVQFNIQTFAVHCIGRNDAGDVAFPIVSRIADVDI